MTVHEEGVDLFSLGVVVTAMSEKGANLPFHCSLWQPLARGKIALVELEQGGTAPSSPPSFCLLLIFRLFFKESFGNSF